MKKFDTKNRLFFDGYDLNEEDLKNVNYIKEFIKKVNTIIFNNEGEITIIPYFNGKIKLDGGISAIILGNDFHFTCHTFAFKKIIFIDYYGDNSKKDMLLELILKNFRTDNYNLGCNDIKGNFGKHILIKMSPILFEEAREKIILILNHTEMTPIAKLLVKKANNKTFDILQAIAESHISLHQHNNSLIIDIFSCKFFNTEKILSIFNDYDSIEEISRGIHYK